jgi:hypothetical protein
MANRINPLLFALLAWALVIAPAANAVVVEVKVIAAGSSAQWQVDAIAAANASTLGGAKSHHYTIKGKCPRHLKLRADFRCPSRC